MSTSTEIEAQVLSVDQKELLTVLAIGGNEYTEMRIGNVAVTVETVALLRIVQLIREAQR